MPPRSLAASLALTILILPPRRLGRDSFAGASVPRSGRWWTGRTPPSTTPGATYAGGTRYSTQSWEEVVVEAVGEEAGGGGSGPR